MTKKETNYAFIDSQNVNLSIQAQGWKLDFQRFLQYLKDQYDVQKAYIFIGYRAGNESLYTFLQNAGYICIFKPTLELPDGSVKGNVDAELVLHALDQIENYDKAVIVTGDGDFYCLGEYLLERNKLKRIIVPNQNRYSSLLDRLSSPEQNVLAFMNALKGKLEYRK